MDPIELYQKIENELPEAEFELPVWSDWYTAEWYCKRYPGFPPSFYEIFEEFSRRTLKEDGSLSPIPPENDTPEF